MSRRLRHIVPVVLAVALAAGPAQASEPVLLRSGQSAVPMVLAEDELQIDGEKGAAVVPGVAVVQRSKSGSARVALLGKSRAALQAAARNLLASGAAREAQAVLYINGNRSDPGSRVLATRRILLEAQPGSDIGGIARDHGLVLKSAAPGMAGCWMVEPESSDLLAAIDAAIALQSDARVARADAVLAMPVASRAVPNDPLIPPITPPPGPIPPNVAPPPNTIEGQWHLDDNENAGLRIKSLWTAGYTGVGTAINLLDGGVQANHEDLQGNYITAHSYDYLRNDNLPTPESIADYHGTVMAGLLTGVGANGMGIAGVAWGAKLFNSKVLAQIDDNTDNRRSILGALPTPDDRLYLALTKQLSSATTALRTWSIVCAWGGIDNGQSLFRPSETLLQGKREAGILGRGGFGSPIFWAAGNGGHPDPNATWADNPIDGVVDGRFGWVYKTANQTYQDNTGFDGYLNRHTIPIAGHERNYEKAIFSEYGPNLIASAPSGGPLAPQGGICSTDLTDTWLGPWTGYVGWMTDQPGRVSESGSWFARYSCNFDTNDRAETDAMDDGGNPAFIPRGEFVLPDDPLVVDQRGIPGYPLLQPGNVLDLPQIRYKDPDVLAYENGAYIPPKHGLGGTSYAAALAAGTGTLMMQARPQLHWRDVRSLMIQRSQDRTDLATWGLVPAPHDPWGWWLPNKTNLVYNCRYGFGALDADALVFGGSSGGVEEPGALDWPLMPALITTPVTASFSYTLNADNARVINWVPPPFVILGTTPPTIDSLPAAPEQIPNNYWTRAPLTVTASEVPARFRVEAVEVDVELTTPGAGGTADWGDWHFLLVSPPSDLVTAPPNKKYGTTCYLGRQRPGGLINQNTTWKWTFTEFVHYAEPAYTTNPPAGTTTSAGTPINFDWYRQWQLLVQDEKNANEGQLRKVDLRLYGFQTYPNPSISSTEPLGLAIGESNSLTVLGTGFASSAGNVNVTQGYFTNDNTVVATAAQPVTSTRATGGGLVLSVPSSLLPNTPGTGSIWIANPAIPLGRNVVAVPPTPAAQPVIAQAPVDAFDLNDDGTPSTVMLSPRPAGQAHMKVCTNKRDVKYSRRPTLSPINDIAFKKGGGSVNVSTFADDADVLARLPLSDPEELSVSVVSLNPYVVANPVEITSQPAAGGPDFGRGNYSFNVSSTAGAGLALIQVTATDGVLTATRTFRVVIQTDKDGSGCGGGMGLALLGIPLVAWLLRRRRR
jgi:subtilisin family serine protease